MTKRAKAKTAKDLKFENESFRGFLETLTLATVDGDPFETQNSGLIAEYEIGLEAQKFLDMFPVK